MQIVNGIYFCLLVMLQFLLLAVFDHKYLNTFFKSKGVKFLFLKEETNMQAQRYPIMILVFICSIQYNITYYFLVFAFISIFVVFVSFA